MNPNFSDRNFRPLLVAGFGASSALLMDVLCLLSSPEHEAIYHWHGSASSLFIPSFFYVFLLSVAIALPLWAIRNNAKVRRIVWSAFLSFLPLAIAKSCALTFGKGFHHKAILVGLILGASLFLVLAFWLKQAIFDRVRDIGQALLLTAAFAGAILLAEDIWAWIEARHLNEANAIHHQAAANVHHPGGRVIWIVLDELAYRQLFQDRPQDLSLPSFDALRAQSTLFSNVIPSAFATEVALPSLMSGLPLRKVKNSPDGNLRLQRSDGGWQVFDEHQSVFSDADSSGYTTAVAGWFIPYCRLLPTVLSDCFWSSQFAPLHGLFPYEDTVRNMMYPPMHLWHKAVALHSDSAQVVLAESEHIQDFLALQQASDRLLNDSHYDFVLLHIPVPHPDGIYDRRKKTFAIDRSNYVDNLALADLYLGHVRQLLEASHQWDDTTLVIMGDHSWRTKGMWQGESSWSREDEKASADLFDSRPAYIVKLPHQETPATVDTPFPAVRTRALLNQLMQGHLQTPKALQQWAKEPLDKPPF